MRKHGVPSFPDPGALGGWSVLMSAGSTSVTVNGIAFGGPEFQRAEKLCEPFGTSASSRPYVGEQQREAMLGFAECMRKHGVSYADPIFPAGGGIMSGNGPAVNKNAPAFKHAATVCNEAENRNGSA